FFHADDGIRGRSVTGVQTCALPSCRRSRPRSARGPGFRVSPESLHRQLTEAGCDGRRALPFHKALLAGELPCTIGGGIGQSRLCMLLLGSAHIGEVQASVWDAATRAACEKAGIHLL